MMLVNSLPRKIAVSHAIVIGISLLLAGISLSYYVLQDYQDKLTRNALTNFAQQVAEQLEVSHNPAQLSGWLKTQAGYWGFRALITDRSGRVLVDTDDPDRRDVAQVALETGRPVLGQPRPSATDRRPILAPAGFSGDLRTASGVGYIYVSVWRIDPLTGQRGDFAVVVMQRRPGLLDNLDDIAPSLIRAGAIALLVSFPLAVFLAKSVSRPVRLMTKASAEMARGNYNQAIPVTSGDELGRLAATFNTMAREVSRTNQALRDLIGNVSHELKTPLTSIQGFSQALLDGAATDPEDQQRAVRIIHEEANRMRRLVDDLLYISKLESGQIKLAREPVDLRQVLTDCRRRVEWQAATKGIDVRLDVPDHPHVFGDGYRLEQVFGNLLENAVRHTPPEGEITVSAHVHPPPEPAHAHGWSYPRLNGRHAASQPGPATVEVAVHNTGSAIPPAEQARIFERFYQIDRSRAQSGAGLGLAIVQELVQAHGGSVTVRSDPDTGTTFTVTLPAPAPAPTPAGAEA